jgi:hypothetical protein
LVRIQAEAPQNKMLTKGEIQWTLFHILRVEFLQPNLLSN